MEQTIIVNRLPSPTWNRLAVNAAAFPAPSVPGVGITLPEAFASIPTGMGKEAEAASLAAAPDYATLEVAEGETQELHFIHALKDGETLADVTLIHAGAHSRVTVLEAYESASEGKAVHMGLTKIIVDEGAELTLIQAQTLNDSTEHFNNIGIEAAADAKVQLIQAELGGRSAMTGAEAVLSGTGSRFESETVYFGDGSRRIDMNFVARHTARRTHSYMKAAGALLGHSDKVYRGTIDFRRGCGKSTGREAEETLLFSDDARNRSVPLILCEEEDVDGQHAATIGRINAARMFYLQSRGLSEAEVRKLMVDAQFAPVISAIPDEPLRNRIRAYLERRLQLG